MYFNPVNIKPMCKKIMLLFFCILVMNHFAEAENKEICDAAKDSAKTQLKRGELGFYLPSKTNAKLYNFIKISKNSYKKIPVRISESSKDTSKSKTRKLMEDAYQASADKSQPLDTSSEFKRCFNLAFQSKLDSVFKCDFFRKADSILMVYDKTGKGYSSVDFPGGAGSLQKYLEKNVSLPKDIKPDDSGKVIRIYYSFFVDEKGALSEPVLVKSNCKVCEESVLAALNKLPAFIPAKDAGIPKKVKYILPYTKMLVKPKE